MISLSNFNTLSLYHFSVDEKINFDLSLSEKENIDIEIRFNLNFSPNSTQEEKDSLISSNFSDTNTFISSILDPNPMPSIEEFIPKNSDSSETRNDSISSQEKPNLFTNTESYSILVKEGEGMLKRKRFMERRPRKENQDNIRKKIKRGFYNKSLIHKLNEKLKNIGSNKYFEKFPPHFVSDIDQKRNKKVFGMTLAELFQNKEIYNYENKNGLNNFSHNMKVVNNEDIINNIEFRNIMERNVGELYKEYINSYEFKTLELNRLKKNKMKDDYVNSYIYLANHLFEFFSQ